MSSNFKVCRYEACQHQNHMIDIDNDKYVKINRKYYHEDCYNKKIKEAEEREKQSSDFAFIKSMWTMHIDRNVSYSYLMLELNKLIAQGNTSEYLAFVMQHIVDNKLKLNYPPGFKFYVNRYDIKNAYAKKKLIEKKKEIKKIDVQSAPIIERDDTPKYAVMPKKKPRGISSIFNKEGR